MINRLIKNAKQILHGIEIALRRIETFERSSGNAIVRSISREEKENKMKTRSNLPAFIRTELDHDMSEVMNSALTL